MYHLKQLENLFRFSKIFFIEILYNTMPKKRKTKNKNGEKAKLFIFFIHIHNYMQ